MQSSKSIYKNTRSVFKDATLKDLFSLLKPRVMSLVVFTGISGMCVAPGHIHPFLAFIAILCIALGSGAAGAINMWYDADIDIIMKRTSNRPIPSGRINNYTALEFGVIIAFFSVFLMAIAVNYLSALLLASAILFYVFIYTIWLKRSTSQNIVIGGAAGAFPPLIGWTAVTNSIDLMPIIMFLIIFMWTPPHFWSLCIYTSEDYKKANIPMLTITHGIKFTKINIIVYTIFLSITGFMPYFLGKVNIFYLISCIILNSIYITITLLLYKDKNNKLAPKAFFYSIIYLFVLFLLIIICKI